MYWASAIHNETDCQTLRDKPLPDSQNDAVSAQSGLVDRAIIMHLLREGEFAVASQLLDDISRSPDGQLFLSTELELSPDALGPNELRRTFSSMHEIISHLRQRNLAPAIAWARENSAKLELRGSHLEFELGQLHFVHLFTGGNSPGDPARARAQALEYSRNHFGHFQKQYLDDIARLAGALAFQPNLEQSPYRHIFANADTWRKLEEAFVREFCSLLGLSAQSPLLLAVTAGAISLPTLQKLQSVMKDKRAEWTTAQELPVEMPLPSAFRFHSVFVCPVSKEQTTDENPPMMMPCGHVIAQETLARMSKGSRFKCPYCPSDSRPEDARKLVM